MARSRSRTRSRQCGWEADVQLNTVPGTDLQLSAVGIGCNNFGWTARNRSCRQPRRSSMPRSTPASRCSTRPTSTAAAAARSSSVAALAGRRDEGGVATKFGADGRPRRRGRRASAAVHLRVDATIRCAGSEPTASTLQLPRPDSASRRSRRRLGGAGRARPGGQGALHRALELPRGLIEEPARIAAATGRGRAS